MEKGLFGAGVFMVDMISPCIRMLWKCLKNIPVAKKAQQQECWILQHILLM